ncbi:protease inhibitor I42 family protein [Methanolobus psychrotolerans]|uniref:protease inhibitor I42 family protein n=1 Tax=Methanolobus psychrotolerans TaxID=1874706 RepID=UPI0013EAC44F|nr:protease inhibitor I42 family protein [Methanolobus psychrotolerans]
MNHKYIKIVAVIAMLSITIVSLGCVATDNNTTQEELPVAGENNAVDEMTEEVQPIMISYSENDSQSTAYALKGDTIIVILEENPTTGYSWNMTASEGLELKGDSYEQTTGTEGLTGAGGSHQWTFEVTDTDDQSLSAVYMRPWEEKTGTEDTFSLDIMVLAEDELIKGSGTVTYQNLEGGFYGIITEDDMHYDPINLAEQFKNDGTKVEFVAYSRDDMMSFHMWGQLVQIRTINEISE